MSSILISILSSTLGLLSNKARDSTAAKLKDGDVTEAKIREIIVREMNNIKTVLDGLSRKELLSSYQFLKEGVKLLNVSLGDSNVNHSKTATNQVQVEGDEASGVSTLVKSEILNEAFALSCSIENLKMQTAKEFNEAIKRFTDARKEATKAFSIETLNIEDRIFAAKVRVISEILEYLESPKTAIIGCLSFLEELHTLPAIRQMFSVYTHRGLWSKLNTSERNGNIKSVMLINYVLFRYVSKFSDKYRSAYSWPTIKMDDRIFYPILEWEEIATRKSMVDELTQPPNRVTIIDNGIYPQLSAVNDQGNVVVVQKYTNTIMVISKMGRSRVIDIHDLPEDAQVIDDRIRGVAIDKSNNVYVIRWLETRTQNGDVKRYLLYTLDENYEVKRVCTLDFLDLEGYHRTGMRVAIKNDGIVMIDLYDPSVYVCDLSGILKHKFERDSRDTHEYSLALSGLDEIIISAGKGTAVKIYSEEGSQTLSIKLPEGHEVYGVAFHHMLRKIIVLSCYLKDYFLLCYTEAGELEILTFFCRRIGNEYPPKITSHQSGPVAVIGSKTITFI